MPVVAAAAVPSLPELLVDLDPDRHAGVRAALSLPSFEVAVLLAGGGEPALHDAPAAVAVPRGAGRQQRPIAVDERLLRAIARRGQAARVQSAVLDGALGTLALLVEAAHPDTKLVPISVVSRADPEALDAVAVGIAAAVSATGQRVAVLATGDLATGADDADELARDWDGRADEALAAGDHLALRSLGPQLAADVGATGWAPLTVLSAVLHHERLAFTRTSYLLTGRAGRFAGLAEPVP